MMSALVFASTASVLMFLLEDIHEFAVAFGNLRDGITPCGFAVLQLDERLPKTCPANGESDESRNGGSRGKPFADLAIVFAAAEDNAAGLVTAVAAYRRDYLLAVFPSIQPFDLPYI